MRKNFLFLLAALIIVTSIQAQKNPPVKKQVNWGIKTGINFSTLVDNSATALQRTWRTGFVTGLFFGIRVNSRLMIQPEFLFSSMGVNIRSGVNSTYRINYFSIPLLARYMVKKKLNVVAGPQFDFLVAAKELNTRLDTEDIGINYKDHSINATAGIEFWPVNAIGLCARYMHGLTDITRTAGSVKNRGVQLTAALKL